MAPSHMMENIVPLPHDPKIGLREYNGNFHDKLGHTKEKICMIVLGRGSATAYLTSSEADLSLLDFGGLNCTIAICSWAYLTLFPSLASQITDVFHMKIAVEGCMHGDLDNVYATLLHLQDVEKTKIDLLICCGDFQAVRNKKDLESLNTPHKFRTMNSFWKYYSGEKVAPFPTIFIGGNHEASNYLWELYYGGWAAPKIYFLGYAGVIKFGNIRIGGLSGIYKSNHYGWGHFEKLPYNERDIRSIYHVREYDVHKLKQVEEPIDIFLSHDWPVGITDHGDVKSLLRKKPFFKEEIREGTLGSKPAAELLELLRPSYWFSAHLHCKFAALVQHGEDGPTTKFLSLDKCLPGRDFLQVIEIESEPGPHELRYDEEWLAITRKFNSILPLTKMRANYSDARYDLQECRHFVRNKLQHRGAKPFDFVRTVPCHNTSQPSANDPFPGHCRNPQTEALLRLLELEYLLDSMSGSRVLSGSSTSSSLNYCYEDTAIDDVNDVDDPDEAEEGDSENEQT